MIGRVCILQLIKRSFGFALSALGIAILTMTSAAAAYAQDNSGQPDQQNKKPLLTAEEVIARARERTAAVRPRPRCPEQSDGDDVVVVCGQIDDGSAYRVPPSTTSRAALGGPPPAPDVAGAGIFKGKPTFGGMCFIPPCPRPMTPMVDFSKIPEIDKEYLARAREAERLERVRQQQQAQTAVEDGDTNIRNSNRDNNQNSSLGASQTEETQNNTPQP